jgi:hypothetical protein
VDDDRRLVNFALGRQPGHKRDIAQQAASFETRTQHFSAWAASAAVSCGRRFAEAEQLTISAN